jgi:hypothetical protein
MACVAAVDISPPVTVVAKQVGNVVLANVGQVVVEPFVYENVFVRGEVVDVR